MENVDVPPGFRFYPTEEELITFYLHNMLQGQAISHINTVIPLIHIYDLQPWHLPKVAGEKCGGDTEQWFFFSERQEREARGGRPNRTTSCGYWKATGSPGYVYSCDNRVIGVKKTMVFYRGKAPCGTKTKWKMNEYKAIQFSHHQSPNIIATPKLRKEFSVCRVYVVSGSSRAFDRRPSRVDSHKLHGGIAAATASSYNKTSHSRGDHTPLMNYNENNDGIQEQELPWELQQFDWLSYEASALSKLE